MQKYLIRVTKEFICLSIIVIGTTVTGAIVTGAIVIPFAFGLTLTDSLSLLWNNPIMYYTQIGLVIFISLIGPLIMYPKKRLTFDASKQVKDVERIMMELSRYKRIESDSHTNNNMLFATKSRVRLFRKLKENIKITTVDGISSIEGNRIVVSIIARRMNKQIG